MDFIKLTDAGLQIATRAEIYSELAIFARAAYGDDLSLDAGTPFDVFLGMLADGLSSVAGATQSMSELLSTKELSGAFLDFVAGQRGIVRKSKRNQTVTMTVTCDSTIERPFLAARNSIFVQDSKGRTWVNTTQLMIQRYKFKPDGSFDSSAENLQGTCEFGLMPLSGYDTDLLYAYNDGTAEALKAVNPSDPMFSEHFTFVNSVNAQAAVAESETDAQFRARYDQAVYSTSTATVDGLRSQLLNFVDFVRIVENPTNSSAVDEVSNPYGLDAHSIWVIVGGGSKSKAAPTVSTDPSDVTVAQTILNYKSLGCGVSTSASVVGGTVEIGGETYNTGNFLVEIPVETLVCQIPFTRLVEKQVIFEIVLYSATLDSTITDSVSSQVSVVLKEYVDGLQPGDIVTTAAVVGKIQSVLSQYDVGLFDFASCEVTYSGGVSGKGIQIYEKAVSGNVSVSFEKFSS